jgi:Cdc6-like AAA superfamily ATPase
MRIKPKDIEIDPNLPKYPFDNDLLDREEEIENLTQIICKLEAPLVLEVNAPWGTGKTTFIRLWCAYLEQQSLDFICFNAWETDFAEDPLIALISKLDKWVTNNGKSQNAKWDKFKKDILPKILKRSLIAGAKVATVGALDMEKDYEKIIADFSGDITGDLIDKFNEKSQAITQFKDVIKKILDKLPKEQKNLIIFIDELDRCRPTYAIELLERVKHLFDIERLVFILSTDLGQLSHSICAVYGNNFESKKYLKRFIDLDYSLKEPDLKKYIDSQFKTLQINTNYYDLVGLTLCITKIFGFKLRDINFLVTRMKLLFLPMSSNQFEPIYITLIALKHSNESLYQEYILNAETSNKIITLLIEGVSKNKDLHFDSGVLISIFSYFIIFEENPQQEKELVDKCELFLLSLNKENNNSYYHSEEIATYVGRLRSELRCYTLRRYNVMRTIIRHIESLNRININ